MRESEAVFQEGVAAGRLDGEHPMICPYTRHDGVMRVVTWIQGFHEGRRQRSLVRAEHLHRTDGR